MTANKQGKSSKPLWINERNTSGTVELDGKIYVIQKQDWTSDDDSERAVLGCILAAGNVGNGGATFKRVSPILRFDDFFRVRHSFIYRAMERIFARGEEIDSLTVATELRKHVHENKPMLDTIGGEAYLLELAGTLSVNVETYARNVVNASLSRSLAASGDMIRSLAANRNMSIDEKAHEAHQVMQKTFIRVHALTEINTFNLADAYEDYMNRVELELADEDFKPGLETGFTYITRKLLGWRKKKMYTIAGSSGMGKSVFLMSSALKGLQYGQRIVFLSLELGLDELLDRITCAIAEVDNVRYQERKLNAPEIDRVRKARAYVKDMRASRQFVIIVMNNPTMTQIRAKLDELMLNPGFDVMFVDYAGWNTISDEGKYRGDTVKHVGAIYNDLNEIKKDYDIPVVVGCQISRGHERRKEKRPMLSDLSDSSLIEKNSDAVIFMFRPEKYEEMPDYPDRAEAILGKNRSGPGGNKSTEVVYLKSELHYYRFSDWRLPSEEDNIRTLNLSDL